MTLTRWIWATLAALLVSLPVLAAQPDYARNISSLIDPAKLRTLGERAANPRLQKCVYWLAAARQTGQKPAAVLDRAILLAGYQGDAAKLTKDALLRNLDVAGKLGCLTPEGFAEMKRGNAPTVMKGPYYGDQLSVDHIIPRAIARELDNVIANLELMPLKMNQRKNAQVGQRQRWLAQKLFQAGLLSKSGLEAILKAK